MKRILVGTGEQFENLALLMQHGDNDLPLVIKPKKDTEILEIGDVVSWRDNYGKEEPKNVTVKTITLYYGDKEVSLEEFPWSGIDGDSIIVSLENGKWAYGSQIKRVD